MDKISLLFKLASSLNLQNERIKRVTDDLESKRKDIINKIDLLTILTYKNAPELIDQINNLKNFVEKIEIKSNSDYDKENKKQKCKYHNRGFCKFKDNCN